MHAEQHGRTTYDRPALQLRQKDTTATITLTMLWE